jgi:hypothetical protein
MHRNNDTAPRAPRRGRALILGGAVAPIVLGLAIATAMPASAAVSCPVRLIDGPTTVQAGEPTDYSVDVQGDHVQDRVYDTLATDDNKADISPDGYITFVTPGLHVVVDRYQDSMQCPSAPDLQVTVQSAAPTPVSLHRPATASTTLENSDWGLQHLTDGISTSLVGAKGYTSQAHATAQSTDAVTVDLGSVTSVGRVVLFPRTAVPGEDPSMTGLGFPSAFSIQLSGDGINWNTVDRLTGQSADDGTPRTYTLGAGYTGRYVRIQVSQFGRAATVYEPGIYRLQFAEMQVWDK